DGPGRAARRRLYSRPSGTPLSLEEQNPPSLAELDDPLRRPAVGGAVVGVGQPDEAAKPAEDLLALRRGPGGEPQHLHRPPALGRDTPPHVGGPPLPRGSGGPPAGAVPRRPRALGHPAGG